jgi:glycosyltransferase involved in cell wall biosynthesis
MGQGPDISDLVDLLDRKVLLQLIADAQRSIWKDLFGFISGRADSRRALLRRLARRLPRQHKRIDQELLSLLSMDGVPNAHAKRLPGIGHYGLFHAEIGIGQGARQMASAIKVAGIPSSLHNISLSQFESNITFDASDSLVSCYDSVLLQFNADTFLDLLERFPLDALYRRRRIGHWVWELPVLPAQWIRAFDKLHEVWVPSRFVAEAVASATRKPVCIVPYPVSVHDHDQHDAREILNLPSDRFIFLTIFDSNSFPIRKNALGATRAFLEAFPKGGPSSPLLVIKCHGRGNRGGEFNKLIEVSSGDNRFILIDSVFSTQEMMMLQAACDCFVSLHRAEGFGLNIAECMSKGKIVVATDFSGSTDFTRPENSLLIPYKMARVSKDDYIYGRGQWWAEPDHEAAVEAMRQAASNGSEVQRRAMCARTDIMHKYSVQAVAKIVKAAWKHELAPFKN